MKTKSDIVGPREFEEYYSRVHYVQSEPPYYEYQYIGVKGGYYVIAEYELGLRTVTKLKRHIRLPLDAVEENAYPNVPTG